MSGSLTDHQRYSRFMALAIALLSVAAFVCCSAFIMLCYGFASTVNPELQEPVRTQLIARRFLFGDHPLQIVLIALFSFGMFAGAVSTVVHLIATIFQGPSAITALKVTLVIGLAGALLFCGYFVWFAV